MTSYPAPTAPFTETFRNIHDPAQSDNILSDGRWDVRDGKLYTDGSNDGSVLFSAVEIDEPVEISFDIASINADKFEATGRYADSFKVEALIDGEWVLLDEFVVDPRTDTLVGSKTGQTFDDDGATLTYSGGALADVDSSVQLRLTSDISARNEGITIDNVSVQPAGDDGDNDDGGEVDPNMVCIDFEGIDAGSIVDAQFEGVTISAQRAGEGGSNSNSPNDAMIFDSANPTGGDRDLASDDQGNILIISEDNDSSDPDDNAGGGTIWFEFDNPSDVQSINVLDAEEGGNIRLLDANGDLISSVTIPGGTDGGIQTVDINVDGVAQIDLTLNGSGAVDDLKFIPGEPVDPSDASISGRYFCDEDGNAMEDAGEAGVSDAVVVLLDGNGDVVARTTTDNNGDYSFEGLAAGDYQVQFEAPENAGEGNEGKEFVEANVGDDATDSDVENINAADGNGTTQVFSVGASEQVTDVDAGVEDVTGSVGGTVFMDNNDNSVEDGGDMAVEGVEVILFQANVGEIARTTTDADGNYLFEGVEPGAGFQVQFDNVDGKTFVDANVGNDDTIDSDALVNADGATSGLFDVAPNEDVRNIDAGVEVVDPGDASISGRYFCDDDDDAMEDAGEAGVAGATVVLRTGDGKLVARTTTDENGEYSFDGLAAGDYQVRFRDPDDVAGQEGKTFVEGNVGDDDSVDSDVTSIGTAGNGITDVFSVGISEQVTDVDAGIEDPGTASLSGRYFVDENDNAVDDGDPGIEGVEVELLDADGNVFATQTTDGNGDYLFENLDAGTYSVRFPADPNGTGQEFVAQDQGDDDAIDSDVNPGNGTTAPIALAIGATVTDVDAGIFTPNSDPMAGDDEAAVCATEEVVVDVLSNDTDEDGDSLTIQEINGQAVSPGDEITLDSGALVTVNDDGTLSYDSAGATFGGVAAEDLLIGEEASDSFSYTVSDGNGGFAEATVDLTVCGGKNTVQTIAENVVPDSGQMMVMEGETGDYTVVISGTGNDAIDGTFEEAYCLDFDAILPSLNSGGKIDVDIDVAGGEEVDYTAVGQNQASPDLEEDLDNVGWVLNEGFGDLDNGDGTGTTYTQSEIQAALWGITNFTVGDELDADGIPERLVETIESTGDGSTIENALEIYNLAITEGEGYEATEAGDIVALLLTPDGSGPDVQPFVVGVDFEDLEEDCDCEV